MAFFLIVRGPLGCGKTTISMKLAKILNAHYISVDKILENNGLDEVDKEIDRIPEKNFIQGMKSILPEAMRELKEGRIVIFDGCFYHESSIDYLVKNLHYLHYIFTLKAPLETCIERDKNRHNRHGEQAARRVHELVSKLDKGFAIDAEEPIDDIVKKIRSRLPQ